MTRGYRFCSCRCARESRARAMLVIARYSFVMDESVRELGDGVAFTIDLGALPHGDGPAAEAMVLREIERAVALHA